MREFLNTSFPLNKTNWKQITKIQIDENKLVFNSKTGKDYLKNNNQFIGFKGTKDQPSSILMKNNNLHLDILIDSTSDVGKIDIASISDIIVGQLCLQ